MTESWEYGEAAAPEDRSAPDVTRFPWPPPEGDSALTAFGETWRSATFDPAAFFARVPRNGGTGAALVYYLVLVLLVAGAGLFWESLALFGGLDQTALGAELGMDAVSPLVGFLLTPFFLLVMLFVSAGITHGLLALFGGARHGFGTTLRVFSYAYSPGLFGAIPLLGGLVGSIWMVVLLVVGLREAQEADGWKAAVAVLLPVALLLVFMVLVFMLALATAASVL